MDAKEGLERAEVKKRTFELAEFFEKSGWLKTPHEFAVTGASVETVLVAMKAIGAEMLMQVVQKHIVETDDSAKKN